jgi:hypothetical protein
MSGFQSDSRGMYIISAPNDIRDYSMDWTSLLATGETIATASFVVPTGLVAGSLTTVGNITTQRITSPTVGTFYVTGTIITSTGEEFNRTFRLIVTSNI